MGLNKFESMAHKMTGQRAWRFTGELISPAQFTLYQWARDPNKRNSFRKHCQHVIDGMTGVVQERRMNRLRGMVEQIFDRRIFAAVLNVFRRKNLDLKDSVKPSITSPRQRLT